MPVDIDTLRTLDIFNHLKSAELGQIASLMSPMKVSEEEILTRRKDPAHTFFIILSGNFMVSYEEGRALTLHEKGDIIGWSTVVTPFRYTGTTVALTDGEVLSMPGEQLLRLVQGNSDLGTNILKKINSVAAERMSFVTGANNG